MTQEPASILFGRQTQHIHCLGVAGAGMAPLALYLSALGYRVSGEDDAMVDEVARLLEKGGVTLKPLPERCDLVVRSSAVQRGHASLDKATERGLAIVRRGELLAEVVRGKKLVAVCGAHGKTTTAAMLATIVTRAQFPAGFLIGGLLGDGSAPARLGTNEWVIAEIDESDGTIERFSPEITVATVLDWDHPDHYRDEAAFEKAFSVLFARTASQVLVSVACQRSRRVAPGALTFGKGGVFSSRVVSEKDGVMGLCLEGQFGEVSVSVRARGDFNASNATAAFAAAQLMGVPPAEHLLSEYPGVRRRQTVLYSGEGIEVIEDYAHHPTEIRALLGSLRARTSGKLVAIFQPHRFSRTLQFKRDFAEALAAADCVLFMDVYPAGEAPIEGGSSLDLHAEFRERFPDIACGYLKSVSDLEALLPRLAEGDGVAFVGAGDIDKVARSWVALRSNRSVGPKAWDDRAEALRRAVSSQTAIRREEPLAERTTMRVGGAARLYAEPASVEDLRALLQECRSLAVPVFFLGRGSNLIVPDDGVFGLVVFLGGERWSAFLPLPDGRLKGGAGLRLKNLCGLAAKSGLVGFEFLEGIPGSVGGALKMNAGAMGGWMFDVVEEVEFMTEEGVLKTMKKSEMHVDYRHCAELENALALSAILRPASQSEGASIARQIDVYRKKRHESQPREPSAGCIFKNPPGTSAGKLIDQSGLKGERVGGAEVSAVHANFIINRGGAASSDILELVRRVRARVRERTGVTLEPEVLLYGKRWKDVL